MASYNRTRKELKLDLQREYSRYLERFPFLKDARVAPTPERELDVHTWLSQLFGSELPPMSELIILVRNGLDVRRGANPWNPA
jgi:hypothetical protein